MEQDTLFRPRQERIRQLLTQLAAGIYERDYALAMAFLSAIARESIFLLGLPGVGNSLIARRLKLAFRNAQSFEYLMSRFSTPDEIFGPVSISKLKDEDTYERLVEGYRPSVVIMLKVSIMIKIKCLFLRLVEIDDVNVLNYNASNVYLNRIRTIILIIA